MLSSVARRVDTATEVRFIEVKGRSAIGSVALTTNEYKTATRLKQDYWLYVVFNCASEPTVYLIQDPVKLGLIYDFQLRPIAANRQEYEVRAAIPNSKIQEVLVFSLYEESESMKSIKWCAPIEKKILGKTENVLKEVFADTSFVTNFLILLVNQV